MGTYTTNCITMSSQDVSVTITDHSVAMMMKQHKKFLQKPL